MVTSSLKLSVVIHWSLSLEIGIVLQELTLVSVSCIEPHTSSINLYFPPKYTISQLEKSSLPVTWNPPWVTKNHHLQSVGTSPWVTYEGWRTTEYRRRRTDDGWQMMDDEAVQVQSELSAGGKKQDVENTPKCTRPNCILARRSSPGLLPPGRHRT